MPNPDHMPAAESSIVRATGRLHAFMQQHPWHPRLIPFFAYILFLPLIDLANKLDLRTYPLLYIVQSALVIWLLWRYRRLLPELTLSFHWLAVPVGTAVLVAWIAMGWWMAGEWTIRWENLLAGRFLGPIEHPEDGQPHFATVEPHHLDQLTGRSPVIGWVSLSLRLVGMSMLVPLFEELFIRSMMLRSLLHWRPTTIGLLQVFQDMPVVGEFVAQTAAGERASKHPPVFGSEFEKNQLGRLTLFGVAASTAIFTLSHHIRDWPACIVCGVAYCLVLAATRRKGLGPVIWAHGITNALLWVYTILTGDWQFF